MNDAAADPVAQGAGEPKFGVFEVELAGDGAVANPFDTIARVTFVPPSGALEAKTVNAFYDGGGTWRARVYASEVGQWQWTSRCAQDTALDGRSGSFRIVDSAHRGRLRPHPKNPRHWMTEDGRWFLNLSDTAYFLLCTHDGRGDPIPFDDFTAYVRDVAARGITSVRCFAASGAKGFIGPDRTDRHRWFDIFTDESRSRFQLANLQNTDRRLKWLFDNHPDIYVQFVLFPLGSRWGRDDSFWKELSPTQKERLLRYMLARYAAFPQLFWLIANDVHYGEGFPNNNAFVREVGEYFQQHDPWQHPRSTGHARLLPFFFGDEDWATYIHLEDEADLSAQKYEPCHRFNKPVFLGEDRYEQDHGSVKNPADMRYFQRRLFWSWLLSGASTNYGGRWWVVHPYSESARRPASQRRQNTPPFTAGLTGLDSVSPIRRFFDDRHIELADFEPDHGLALDPPASREETGLKLMRRATAEYIVYHPNAASDGIGSTADTNRTARFRVDLSRANGDFSVEWYRAEDGATQESGTATGGSKREFTSPWKGCDVILRLAKSRG